MNLPAIKPCNLVKLNELLDIIESIEVTPEGTHIKLNNNLMIESNNSIVTITKGFNVILAKQIHLNPILESDPDFKILDSQIQEALDSTPKSIEFKNKTCDCGES